MCHKDPPRKLCILYEEEAPFAGLPPFLFSVQCHSEGVALLVAFSEKVLPEVDLNHLADRAAGLFKKPKRLDRVRCPAGVGEGLDAVLLHAGGDGFHIPIPDDVVEVEDLVLVVSGIPVGSPNLAGNVAQLNDPVFRFLRCFSCGIPLLCCGGCLVGFLCFCDGVVVYRKLSC